MKIYVASAWWRDSEPFVTVVSDNEQRVRDLLQEQMASEAERAASESEPDDTRELDDYLDEIAWSGIFQEDTDAGVVVLTEDENADLAEHGYVFLGWQS